MKHSQWFRMAWVLPALFALFLVTLIPAEAATHTVCSSGCEFMSIQSAIDAAVSGDTILVAPGNYNEALIISSKSNISLEGSGCTVTTVMAPGHGPAISISDSLGITVTGFRLSSVLVRGDNFEIGAVRILDSFTIRIFKNLITEHSGSGIVLYGSDIEVFNNIIAQNGDDGIRLEAINSPAGNTALIYNNTISDHQGGSGVGL